MKRLTLLLIASIALIQTVSAGFPIGTGRWMLIPGYNYYNANGYWNKNSAYNAYPNGNFSSHYFGISGGYGLNRKWDFLFNVPFVVQVDNNTTGTKNTYIAAGLGDTKFGLSYFFTDLDAVNHVSLTGSLILPLYSNRGAPWPNIGFQSLGGELKLGFSGSATGGFRNPYYDIELGVRQYFSTDGPAQAFINITGGVPLDDNWKLSGTLNYINSVSSTVNSSSQVFYNYNKNFNYSRAGFNVGRVINENFSLWGGMYADIYGTSVGRGSGLSLSAVIKF